MDTNIYLSGQNKSQGETSKSQKNRNRPRIHLTLREESEPQLIFIG